MFTNNQSTTTQASSLPLKMAVISTLALGGSTLVHAEETSRSDPSSSFRDFMDTSKNVTSVHKLQQTIITTNQEESGYYDRVFTPIRKGATLVDDKLAWNAVLYAEPLVVGFTTDTFAV